MRKAAFSWATVILIAVILFLLIWPEKTGWYIMARGLIAAALGTIWIGKLERR